ncbi:hypothetical protein NCAST_14_00190 [Nocardia asteroides NBRC 15531]|uniref:Uncharacterized protein n=1 Tax=Nocardia asteroides NBRC 15531 TaxID=1110697 RepID=U5E6V2_NOCAS|nr:hypothetical protein NCAST_14_00190 [Nocardia asteroides NBRC 15531]
MSEDEIALQSFWIEEPGTGPLPREFRLTSAIGGFIGLEARRRVRRHGCICGARRDVRYLELFRNRQRRHSGIGMLTSMEYENATIVA